MKNILNSLTSKFFVIFGITMVIVTVLVVFLLASVTRVELEAIEISIKKQAVGNVNFLHSLLDRDDIREMFENKDEESDSYSRIRGLLDKIIEKNDNIFLAYCHGIDSYVNENKTMNLGIPTVLKGEVEVGTYYPQTDTYMEAVNAAINTGVSQTTDIYTDTFGTWISALAPFVNEDGSVDVLLGVDYNAETIKSGKQVFNVILFSSLGLMIAIIILMFIGYRIIQKSSYLDKKVRESNETIEKQLKVIMENEKMASLGNLVAGVAHEINTPLGVAISTTSYVENENKKMHQKLYDGKMSKNDLMNYMEATDESMKILISSLNNAARLVSSFKKIAVEQGNTNYTIYNIRDVIDAVLMSLKHEYKNENCEFEVICPETFPVYSDSGALIQILNNLIINSLKHAQKNEERLIIRIEVRNVKNEIELIFSDNGRGIEKSNMKKIFEPFYTTNRANGGSGLGLNIVYNLVLNRLMGTINAESEYGKYTKFFIKFPGDIEK